MMRQKAVPAVSAMLAARRVVRRQKTPITKTAAMGGAMKPNTDWKILKRLRPLMLSIATVRTMARSAPTTVTIRPM